MTGPQGQNQFDDQVNFENNQNLSDLQAEKRVVM
jgi:hypothetical protein